jgi:predicted permease
MITIFLETLPFFALIGLGLGAARLGFFPAEATGYLTKFVFYFALTAMLFNFSANLGISEIWQPRVIAAYLLACLTVYLAVMIIAFLRRATLREATIEAQCGIIGNTGFMGLPMLALLLGPESVPYMLIILSVDLVVFSSLFTMMITLAGQGQIDRALPLKLLGAVARNPMVAAMVLGLAWASTGFGLPAAVNDTLTLLGAAATPGALFAIGASLADKRVERLGIVSWLTLVKLGLHPLVVAIFALVVFQLDPIAAAVLIAAASLPVAGNVFILAQHYNAGPARVSATILVSTLISMATIPVIVAWVGGF